MKSDKDEANRMLVYSLSKLEAYAMIESLAKQLVAMEQGVSCGVFSIDCEKTHILFGINCIE